MAAEHWLRWHHGTVTDPKWRVVAARAGHALSRNVTVGHVLSVWAAMLECASQASPRGQLVGWDDEDIGVALGVPTEEVAAIRTAMQGKTLDGDDLKAWNTRQPKREDRTATDRKRAQREREKKGVPPRDKKEGHTPSRNVTTETETETETEEEKHSPASLEDIGDASPAVRACWLVRQQGCDRMNPHHPDLLAALEVGATPDEISATYAEGLVAGKTNPWAWALTTARNRHMENPQAGGQARASPGKRPSLVTADFTDAAYAGTPTDELPPELR